VRQLLLIRVVDSRDGKKGASPMSDLKELRRNGEDCLQQVRSATTASDKVLLLNIAYACLKLGEQVAQRPASAGSAPNPETRRLP
jgi:hypothetical protein